MNVETSKDNIFITFVVQARAHASKSSRGKITLMTPTWFESAKHPESPTRQDDPGIQFGTDEVTGSATITLSVQELYGLAVRASRNKNMRAQQGPAKARFIGVREFHSEEE